jgi:hypothetical protein
MGTERTPRHKRFQAISRLDPRWTVDRLRAKGALAYDSDYTERGARAGIPEPLQESSLALSASGTQGDDGKLELLVRRAGHPIPDGGGYVVRDVTAGDAEDEYLGHDGFQVITGWDGSLRHDISGSGSSHRVPVIRLRAGDLLAVETNNGLSFRSWLYAVGTGVWSNVSTQTLTPGTSSVLGDPALVQLPSGRVLFLFTDYVGRQVHVRFSDDDGVTWADYSTGALVGSSDYEIHALSAAYAGGAIVLFTVESNSGTLPEGGQQWVSHDLGATFTKVGSPWFGATSPQERPCYVSLAGLPSGQVGMLYFWVGVGGPGTERYAYRILDPSAPGYETDPAVDVAAPAYAQASTALWLDEDGILYSLTEALSGTSAHTDLARSHDGGATWAKQKIPTLSTHAAGTERPHNYAVASTGGRAAWVMRFASLGATADQSIGVAYLGGHSWATVGIVDDGTQDFTGRSFLGWAQEQSGDTRFGGCYMPFNSPTSQGWTQAGAGTASLASPNVWHIQTVGATLTNTFADPSSVPSIGACNVGALLRVVSGGDLANPDVTLRVRISDYDAGTPANATKINEVGINFTTTGFRVMDVIDGIQKGSDVSWDMTLPTWIFIAMRADASNGEVAIWYGRPSGPARRLTLALAISSLADDSGTNPTDPSRVLWGHANAGNAVSEWGPVGFCFAAGAFAAGQATNFVSSWDNPTDLRARDFAGQSTLLLDGVRIRAVDGPARLGELWAIRTRYDYGVANIHPQIAPSPRVPWRSKSDASDVRIVWEQDDPFTDSFRLNDSMLFLLMGCNFREAKIRVWGGGVWNTIATLDASDGFSGLTFARKGSGVRPDNDVASVGERYLWRHEHAGDTIDLGSGEGDRYQRIITNSEGAWRSDGSGDPRVKQPTLLLDQDLLGAGAPSSGTADIWCRDFGAVVREYTKHVSRWCLEIPAQATVEGYFQIGTFFAGDLLVFGQEYDLGWVWTREINTSLSTRVDGSRRARVQGPPRRTLQIGWVETAVQVRQEQADSPDPDWISSGFRAFPLASRGDVIRAMEGLIEQTAGPAEPVVYLSRVPSTPEGNDALLLTDRRRWLYGRIATSPKTEALAARTGEAVDEVERLNTVTLEEEV